MSVPNDEGLAQALREGGVVSLRETREIERLDAELRQADMEGGGDAAADLGILLQRSGDAKGAEAAFRRADDRGSARGAYNLGIQLIGRGQLTEAEAVWRRAGARGDPRAASSLGLLAERAGRPRTAVPKALSFVQKLSGTTREPSDMNSDDSSLEDPLAFDFRVQATHDLPASEDLLGFMPLVRALYLLLGAKTTVLPLAIAITGPWGAGKSSLMFQLKTLLDATPPRSTSDRRWATVDFPAWKYERSERLWAALAKAIYEQPQRHMSLAGKVAFRVKLEQRRLGWTLDFRGSGGDMS